MSPSGRGQTGGAANSPITDHPWRKLGKPPQKTNGEPSTSSDVNASLIMQNMIMNDDDIEWYNTLFKKQAKTFLHPEKRGSLKHESFSLSDQKYGIYAFVPNNIVKQLEVIYPKLLLQNGMPLHITVLYLGILSEEQEMQVRNICSSVLRTFKPFDVKIDGTFYFENDFEDVFCLKVFSKRLIEIHYALKHAIQAAGISVEHEHDFVPHITLSFETKDQKKQELSVSANWIIDRFNIINNSFYNELRLGTMTCLGCMTGCCAVHSISQQSANLTFDAFDIKEAKLLIEPELDKKKKKQKAKKESSSVGGGNIAGALEVQKIRKKNAKVNAKAFGGGKVVGKY